MGARPASSSQGGAKSFARMASERAQQVPRRLEIDVSEDRLKPDSLS